MPNKNSKAGHIAQRTCVVCRKKSAQNALLSFFLLNGKLVFDLTAHIQCRKYYLCGNAACAGGLPKWVARHTKKHAAKAGKGAGK